MRHALDDLGLHRLAPARQGGAPEGRARLVALAQDELTAQAIQLAIEYDPQPPFRTGSLPTAPQAVRDRAVALLTAGPSRPRA